MKTFALLFATILGLVNAFGQDYFPLVSEDKQWNVLEVTENGPYPWDTVYQTLTYKFEGDTVVNNNTYLKVYKSYEEIPVNWSYEGGIREDEDKKVWSVYNSGYNENLLYDFSLYIGDTMVFDEGYVEMVVDTITMVDIGNTVRKKYHLRYYNDPVIKETWIEGIGSSLGILTSGTEGYDGGGYWFLCMTENGGLIYMNPNYNSCYLINTKINEIKTTDINIYPNPASGLLIIENLSNIKINSIRLIDLFGQTKKIIKNNQTSLDLSYITSGSYFLILETENGLLQKKIIVH